MHGCSRMAIDLRIPIFNAGTGHGGVLDNLHIRSRMVIDPRVPTMPGRSMSGFP